MANIQDWLNQALHEHQAGNFAAAEPLYRRILKSQPRHADANSLLGALLLQQARCQDAIQYLRATLQVQPNHSVALTNLGTAYRSLGKPAESVPLYRRVLRADPANVDALLNLAGALAECKDFSAAEAAFLDLLKKVPQHPVAMLELGKLYSERGQFESALPYLEQSVILNALDAEAHACLGVALYRCQRTGPAEQHLRRACELNPTKAENFVRLGEAVARRGDLDEGERHYRRAIELKPTYVEALSNLAEILLRKKHYDEAARLALQALDINPQALNARLNYGAACLHLGQWATAEAMFRQCVEQAPNNTAALLNLANTLWVHHGPWAEMGPLYRRVLALEPNHAEAHWTLSLYLLVYGELEQGWAEYEWGFAAGQRQRRAYPLTEWHGEDLHGRRILVYGEQGVGDQILFASCLPDVVRAGARVTVHLDPRLVPLFRHSFPSCTIEPFADEPTHYPSTAQDYCVAMGSLPRYFRQTPESFPRHQVFLSPEPAAVEIWQRRLAELGPHLKVGIAWRSGFHSMLRAQSYIDILDLAPVFAVPGVQFVNLQYGDATAEIASAREKLGARIHVFEDLDLFNDFSQAAALSKALDVVISPATSTYMLAGAVGQETWLIGHMGYIKLGMQHHPWLANVRSFLLDKDGWEPVLRDVTQALVERCKTTTTTAVFATQGERA